MNLIQAQKMILTGAKISHENWDDGYLVLKNGMVVDERDNCSAQMIFGDDIEDGNWNIYKEKKKKKKKKIVKLFPIVNFEYVIDGFRFNYQYAGETYASAFRGYQYDGCRSVCPVLFRSRVPGCCNDITIPSRNIDHDKIEMEYPTGVWLEIEE